jgi:hypothetical protein
MDDALDTNYGLQEHNMKPTQEYGYRMLTSQSVQEGDEIWVFDRWERSRNVDQCQASGIQYRRRIDPGEGWEIVPANIPFSLQNTDWQWTNDGLMWWDVTPQWNAVDAIAYRRRKHPEQDWFIKGPNGQVSELREGAHPKPVGFGSGWIACSESLPETGHEIAVLAYQPANGGEYKTCITRWLGTTFRCNPQPSHWMPLPVAPVPSAMEQAFEKAWGAATEDYPTERTAKVWFSAGWEAAY